MQLDFDEDDGEQSSATMELPGETRLRSNKVTRWVYCKTEGICNLMWQVLHLILIFSTLTGKEWPWTVKEDGLSNQQQQPGRPGVFINGQPGKPGSTFWQRGEPEFACQCCHLRQLLQELLGRRLFNMWQLRRTQHPNKQFAEKTIFIKDWWIRFWGFRAWFGENWAAFVKSRGWAEQEPSICAGTGYPVPVFQIPVPAEPVPDIWQEKSRKICNSLNWFQRVTFTFQKNINRNKIFLLIFLIVETSMPVIPVAQRQKQDIPYSHKYLVSFPLNP